MSNIDNFEKLLRGASEFLSEYDMLMEENKKYVEMLNERSRKLLYFMDISQKIAMELGITWFSGEFPIDEVMEKIRNAGR
jgi:hypothetical protein